MDGLQAFSLESHLEDVERTGLICRDNLIILPHPPRAQGDRGEPHGEAVQTHQTAVAGGAGEGTVAVVNFYWVGQVLRQQREMLVSQERLR